MKEINIRDPSNNPFTIVFDINLDVAALRRKIVSDRLYPSLNFMLILNNSELAETQLISELPLAPDSFFNIKPIIIPSSENKNFVFSDNQTVEAFYKRGQEKENIRLQEMKGRLNIITCDLNELGFSTEDCYYALQETEYRSEHAFNILYQIKHENNELNIIDYSKLYNDYNNEEKDIVDHYTVKYNFSVEYVVEAFESCKKNASALSQLLCLLNH